MQVVEQIVNAPASIHESLERRFTDFELTLLSRRDSRQNCQTLLIPFGVMGVADILSPIDPQQQDAFFSLRQIVGARRRSAIRNPSAHD